MIENKNFASLTFIFISFCAFLMPLVSIFAKSESKSVDGNVNIANRQYPDIILDVWSYTSNGVGSRLHAKRLI